MFRNYRPQQVRRVYIPKANGKVRPLGIPSIWDRLLQQCIKQTIEPICESKFANNSYGFRPKRNQEHALAEVLKNVNVAKHSFIVNVDIKGFFDNVDHSLLLKQLWSIGIRDKQVLMVIKKMLKAEIVEPTGEIIKPIKGTPQGGILSPLLSNIVLNDLDNWVNDQWRYCGVKVFNNRGGTRNETSLNGKQKTLKKNSNLKVGYLIRYADDFIITCRSKNDAERWSYAIENYLKRRLKLNVEESKSKIINLRKEHTEFLGFKIKLKQKTNGKWIARTSITDKKKKIIIDEYRELIKNTWTYEDAKNLNLKTIGLWEYYEKATDISLDMNEIAFKLLKKMYNHFSVNCEYRKMTKEEKDSTTVGLKLKKLRNDCKVWFCDGMPIMPIGMGKTRYPLLVPKGLEPYLNEEGKMDWFYCIQMLELDNRSSSEFAINRISKYAQQRGKCFVTKEEVGLEFDCHHITPRYLEGNDSYNNLVIIKPEIHRLVHAKNEEYIIEALNIMNLNDKELRKINQLRRKCELSEI